MTKDEALEHIYSMQNNFRNLCLDKDILDVVMPLLSDVAKIISKIDKIKDEHEQRKIDADTICDLMIDMLNDGTIETRDIGKVNMMIRNCLS